MVSTKPTARESLGVTFFARRLHELTNLNVSITHGLHHATSLVLTLLFSFLLTGTARRSEAQELTLVPLGLLDPVHRDVAGATRSEISEILPSGIVLGTSRAFQGMPRPQGNSVWLFDPRTANVKRLGLLTDEEQDANGFFRDAAVDVNNQGMVLGETDRGTAWYALPLADQVTPLVIADEPVALNQVSQLTPDNRIVGQRKDMGYSYHPATSAYVEYGLVDVEHRRADGRPANDLHQVDPSGNFAIGIADRYLGQATKFGQSAWVANVETGETHRLGLVDVEHFSTDLIHRSRPYFVTSHGYVAGVTARFDGPGSSSYGDSAWLYDPNLEQSVRLGFIDAAHTSSRSGQRDSSVYFLTDNGLAVGESQQYDENGDQLGRTLWQFDPITQSHHVMGLAGEIHTQPGTGRQNSSALMVSDSGYVAGYSTRYHSSTGSEVGATLWLFDPATATSHAIAPSDAAFTGNDGRQVGTILRLSDDGTTYGSSERFRRSASRGHTPWVYEPATEQTLTLELTGDVYVSSDQSRFSAVQQITESGFVVGDSRRYCGARDCGKTAWLFDPESDAISPIGLFEQQHFHPDGFSVSYVRDVNEHGQAIGYSASYLDEFDSFEDAWMYDHDSDQVYPLRFSEQPSGRANTTLFDIAEDGSVLGEFSEYDETGRESRKVAFRWSVDGGMEELNELVAGGLESTEFDQIIRANSTDSIGQIFGVGELTNSGEMPLMLRPVVAGDLNGDLTLNARDIDWLAWNIRRGTNDLSLDLNGDGLVDAMDHTYYVANVANTFPGDADLDGSFRSSDLVLVFQAGEYRDEVPLNSGWGTGDWTGDGDFDSDDLVAAFQTGAYEFAQGAQIRSVPEPSGLGIPCAILLAVINGYRRSR